MVMSLPISQVLNATATFLDSRSYLDALRMLNLYSFSHVRERRRLSAGPGTKISPNVSCRNGQRIAMGRECRLDEHYRIRAADSTGTIGLGDHVMLAPGVFLTASNYQARQGMPISEEPKFERDIRVGSDVWLGAPVVVTAGVTIGDSCITGAGVVTKDLPVGSITGGVPAKIIGTRPFIS